MPLDSSDCLFSIYETMFSSEIMGHYTIFADKNKTYVLYSIIKF